MRSFTNGKPVSWWAAASVTSAAAVLMAALATAGPASAEDGSYLVRTNGAVLNIRTGPGTEHPVVGYVNSGDRVRIECIMYDNAGAIWDKISDGFVIDKFIVTGTSRSVAPSCDQSAQAVATAPPASAAGGTYPVRTNGAVLNIRTGPGAEHPVVGQITSGDRVRIECIMYDNDGELWDKIGAEETNDGVFVGNFVKDRYVVTGTTQPVAPQCDEWTPQEEREKAAINAELECSLGASYEEVRSLLFGDSCTVPPEVMAPDLQMPLATARTALWEITGEPVRYTYIDGCTAPTISQALRGLGDKDQPFGFQFLPACNVHDLGYRLMDREILTDWAEPAMDQLFYDMLLDICAAEHSDRRDGCNLVAGVYAQAVSLTVREEGRSAGVYAGD